MNGWPRPPLRADGHPEWLPVLTREDLDEDVNVFGWLAYCYHDKHGDAHLNASIWLLETIKTHHAEWFQHRRTESRIWRRFTRRWQEEP